MAFGKTLDLKAFKKELEYRPIKWIYKNTLPSKPYVRTIPKLMSKGKRKKLAQQGRRLIGPNSK